MNFNKTHILLSTCWSTKMFSLYHFFILDIYPYNKTIIDFHGGEYRVILTPYS